MPQSLLDDESSPSQDGNEGQLHPLEKAVDTSNCDLILLRQHVDNGLALVRADGAARFNEFDLRIAERFAEAERRNAERFHEAECKNIERIAEIRCEMRDRFDESARRQHADMGALANQLQAQMIEMDKRQEARIVEMSRRQDAFSRWMVGLTVGVVVLVGHMASRLF